jgi:hypothetical protein
MQIAAIVSNDPNNAGVDWSLTCQNTGNCGSLTPLHTASGQAVTYVPPASLAVNSQTVNIVAFATADHTKNKLATVDVTGFAGTLKGTYVLQTRGVDVTGYVYHFAGAVVLDGNGGITSGEQTYTDISASYTDVITGGSYFIGPDGRGTMTLNTSNQNIGQQGLELFNLVLLSSSSAFISKVDDPNLTSVSNETSNGTMELQTSAAAPSAGYAFAVSGTDVATFSPTAFGGIVNIDSPGAISGTGSVADQDVGGAVTTNSTISGTVLAPDALGAVRVDLTAGFTTSPIQFMGYIVDSTHIKLVECDNASGTGLASSSGIAIGQGTATGTFTSNSSLSGNYVLGLLGEDFSGLASSLTWAGLLTSDGVSKISGLSDEFYGGLFLPIRDQVVGQYNVDATGTGRIDTSMTFKKHGPGPEVILYLTGNGNPPLVLDFDNNLGSVGAGVLYPQAPAPLALSGKYAVRFTEGSFGSEIDAAGEFVADNTADTLAGNIDTDFFFTAVPDTSLTGTFNSIPITGRAAGTLSNELFLLPSLNMVFYLMDSQHGLFIESDLLTSGQVTLGYFSARTPICVSCP